MVELPLALLGKLERKHILYLVVGTAAAQPLMMMGAADLAAVIAWDMAIYVDAAIATYAAAMLAKSRAALQHLRARAAQWLRRPVTRARPRRPAAGRIRPPSPATTTTDRHCRSASPPKFSAPHRPQRLHLLRVPHQ
ncbi:MAG TPA: hypothetical protein VEZ41_01615 [Allosphingosinicella sp.]|nr:hypothetical protein [Allosphingosinicella sp.]